jgi:hypothetical protein
MLPANRTMLVSKRRSAGLVAPPPVTDWTLGNAGGGCGPGMGSGEIVTASPVRIPRVNIFAAPQLACGLARSSSLLREPRASAFPYCSRAPRSAMVLPSPDHRNEQSTDVPR